MSLSLPGMTAAGSRYLSSLEQLSSLTVDVGFLDSGSYPNGISVAEVAAVNEYGTSSIPSRPFMQQMADNHAEDVKRRAVSMGKSLASGASVEAELESLGEAAVKLVQDTIESGSFTPNSPATMARKGSSTPLIDTGLMKDSVTYEVRSQ